MPHTSPHSALWSLAGSSVCCSEALRLRKTRSHSSEERGVAWESMESRPEPMGESNPELPVEWKEQDFNRA